jgi:hypothetical protein
MTQNEMYISAKRNVLHFTEIIMASERQTDAIIIYNKDKCQLYTIMWTMNYLNIFAGRLN